MNLTQQILLARKSGHYQAPQRKVVPPKEPKYMRSLSKEEIDFVLLGEKEGLSPLDALVRKAEDVACMEKVRGIKESGQQVLTREQKDLLQPFVSKLSEVVAAKGSWKEIRKELRSTLTEYESLRAQILGIKNQSEREYLPDYFFSEYFIDALVDALKAKKVRQPIFGLAVEVTINYVTWENRQIVIKSKPTVNHIHEGLTSNSTEVRRHWAARSDFVATREQIERGLKDKDAEVRENMLRHQARLESKLLKEKVEATPVQREARAMAL